MLRAILILLWFCLSAPAFAGVVTLVGLPDEPQDHISDEDRARIWREIGEARAKLLLPKAGEPPRFIWPLRAARGFSAPHFERISNFVDHNAAYPSQLRDYQCGTRTYDRDNGYNHKGIDISLWPDNWNLMASGQIEVIAAAPGTILNRIDGNFDRNCAFNSNSWNAVYVQHDDGSVAWYGHLKNGSVTSKRSGDRVVAGEYLGTVGSSGNSTGPHLHLEVYDSANRLIDPFAGSCNAMNAASWWASQPEYYQTHVNRVVTQSAAPVFSTCSADGTLANAGTLNEKTSFAPGEPVVVAGYVRDLLANQPIHLRVLRPDGSVYSSSSYSAAHPYFSSAYAHFSVTLPTGAATGIWFAEVQVGSSVERTPFSVSASGTPIANYTDMWWNAAEPGWGVNLNHQSGTIFATWFTYGADGRGTWFTAILQAAATGQRFTGSIYRTTGVPYNAIANAPASTSTTLVGSATLEFATSLRGTFEYDVQGVRQTKPIERQVFSTATQCTLTLGSRTGLTNYQDIWWNATESGWGLNIAHQGEVIFATWFTYGADGAPQWFVAPNTRRQPTAEFTGRVYRTQGVRFDAINGPAQVGAPTDVGEVLLRFPNGERADFSYTVEGATQSKVLTRQVFGDLVPLCR